MTPATLTFLRDLLTRQSIPVGDPGLMDLARAAAQALDEIDEALGQAAADPQPQRGPRPRRPAEDGA